MSNFHRDPLSYSHVGCCVHQRPCSLAGCLARVLFKPFCPAQAGSALACTVTNPGTGRRGSRPAVPVQLIQKRDGQGGRKKSERPAKPQPPWLAHGGQLSGSAPRQPSPRAGSLRWAGGGEEGPGGPAPAARRGPPRTAAGPSAPPKPARAASRGRYRPSYTFPEPGSRPLTSCGRRPRRGGGSPGAARARHPSPRLLYREGPAQPQRRRPGSVWLRAARPPLAGAAVSYF